MSIRAIAEWVFAFGTVAGLVCLFISLGSAVFSRNRYEDEFWSLFMLAGLAAAVLCGLVLTCIRTL